jgi:hypothetical protein
MHRSFASLRMTTRLNDNSLGMNSLLIARRFMGQQSGRLGSAEDSESRV